MKILIYYQPNELGMSDFRTTDYSILADRARRERDGKIPNFGNKLWLQGIISAISVPENTYEFGYENLTVDYINNNYDCILYPAANLFYKQYIPYLEKRTTYIKKIKIPVFVIACGVQANSYDNLNNLVAELKIPATNFIKAVYNTGGQFALRGYFTQEFFYKLGFFDAVVTGCPSLYQMGRDLFISNEKVSRERFLTAINGTFHLPISKRSIESSDFICQDRYGKFLYDSEYVKNIPFSLNWILKNIKRGEYDFVKALAENRIKLFADTQQWMSYYVKNSIKYSFGSRIHGTIMPILSGVPSFCCSMDARTREMVEFFDVPHVVYSSKIKKQDLYDWYLDTDYTKFNDGFKKRFDDYESFLRKCGLVKNINQNNIFMQKNITDIEMPLLVNQKQIDELGKQIIKYRIFFDIIDYCCR